MPNWLERHISKTLNGLRLGDEDITEVWFRPRNPRRVVLTIERRDMTAFRLSIPIPQGKGR